MNHDFFKKYISFKGYPINSLSGTRTKCGQIFIMIIFKLHSNMGAAVNERQVFSVLNPLNPPSPGISCSDLDLWFSF